MICHMCTCCAGLRAKDIDILVVNCSLFNPTPSLSAMIVNHFKMRSNVLTYNLAGVLCNSASLHSHLRGKIAMTAHHTSERTLQDLKCAAASCQHMLHDLDTQSLGSLCCSITAVVDGIKLSSLCCRNGLLCRCDCGGSSSAAVGRRAKQPSPGCVHGKHHLELVLRQRALHAHTQHPLQDGWGWGAADKQTQRPLEG